MRLPGFYYYIPREPEAWSRRTGHEQGACLHQGGTGGLQCCSTGAYWARLVLPEDAEIVGWGVGPSELTISTCQLGLIQPTCPRDA